MSGIDESATTRTMGKIVRASKGIRDHEDALSFDAIADFVLRYIIDLLDSEEFPYHVQPLCD